MYDMIEQRPWFDPGLMKALDLTLTFRKVNCRSPYMVT